MPVRNALAIGLSIAACGCSPNRPARGVDYFKAHIEEARSVVAQCEKAATTGEECSTAQQAIASIRSDEMFNEATKMSPRKPNVGRNW